MARTVRTRAEEIRAYWLFVLPAFILYILIFAFPIIISVVLSLSDYKGGKLFGGEAWGIRGFQEYGYLINDANFWAAFKNNIYIVLVSVFGQLPLGFLFAYLIFRKIVKFGDFWQGVLYMPAIMSVIVLGVMWKLIFASDGLLAQIINQAYISQFSASLDHIINAAGGLNFTDDFAKQLAAIGDPRSVSSFADASGNTIAGLKDFLAGNGYTAADITTFKSDVTNLLAPKWVADFMGKPDIAMIPICFVILWCWTGLYLVLFLANMQKIDVQIIEAARIDGASEMQVMTQVIVPSLSGVIVNAAILCISGSLNTFALIFAINGANSSTQVLSTYMYQNGFIVPNPPFANSISVAIILFSFVLIGLTKLAEKRFGGRE